MIRPMFRFFAFVMALLSVAVLSHAAWPEKPVRIVVPFAPGGATDVVARALGQRLSQAWGQPIVIENRTGAGGNIGADLVAKAPHDGYTLLMATVSTLSLIHISEPTRQAEISYA